MAKTMLMAKLREKCCGADEEEEDGANLCRERSHVCQKGAFKVYKRDQDMVDRLPARNSMEETNAYGQVEFVSCERRSRAQYIRLSDQTELGDIEQLMKKVMSLEEWPNILISAVGGLKFNLSEKLKKKLQSGLQNICMNVGKWKKNIWFVTGAIDAGVTQIIAEAVGGYKLQKTKVIGITSWRAVANSEKLKQEAGKYKLVQFPIIKQLQQELKTLHLNKDHTHFFLVDGCEDNIPKSKEIKFRSKFEDFIVSKQISTLEKSSFIPAVQLVINGGYITLLQIFSTLFPNEDVNAEPIMPIIVIEGSGRIADWIATVCSDSADGHSTKAEQDFANSMDVLRADIKHNFPTEFEEVYHLILKITKERREYITIYKDAQNLDEVILQTFIKIRSKENVESTEKDTSLLLTRFKMTMLLNGADTAKQQLKLPTEGRNAILKKLLVSALVRQNQQFIDLIFDFGFDMTTVDKSMLGSLYGETLERNGGTGLLLMLSQKYFPRKTNCDMYLKSEEFVENEVCTAINRIASFTLVDYEHDQEIKDPLKDLFLWAVMCNRQETALALWKRGENQLAKALVARRLYLQIAKEYRSSHYFDDHVYKTVIADARYFEDLSYNVLEKCSTVEIESTERLIRHRDPNWGNKNILELAALSQFRYFISHPRCNDVIECRWKGDISADSNGQYLKRKFKRNSQHDGSATYDSFSARISRCIDNNVMKSFSAPVTKFWINTILYLVFLCIFIFVMLNKLEKNPNILEYTLLVFVISYFLDEVRQFLNEDGSFLQKWNGWILHSWNMLDGAALLFFTIAFILRNIPNESTLIYSRIFYAMDIFLWVFKLLRLFSLNRKIGVYVVMLNRMLNDVMHFVIIILVVVIAYSIARFAVLYPDNEFSFTKNDLDKFLAYAFMIPFFQIFGDSFLERPGVKSNVTVFGTHRYDRTRHVELFMMTLTFIYMVISTLLLVNLLIAVFNYTYTIVQENSNNVWHWQSYQLVVEYENRSFLPSPFSIISHIYVFARYLIRKIREKRSKVRGDHCSFETYFKKDCNMYWLHQFESECLLNYLIDENKVKKGIACFPNERRKCLFEVGTN